MSCKKFAFVRCVSSLVMVAVVTACGSPNSAGSSATMNSPAHSFEIKSSNQTLLIGQWSDSCRFENEISAYVKLVLTFLKDNKFEVAGDRFSDKNCTQFLSRDNAYSGTYAVSDVVDTISDSVRKIDLYDDKSQKAYFGLMRVSGDRMETTDFAGNEAARPATFSSHNSYARKK